MELGRCISRGSPRTAWRRGGRRYQRDSYGSEAVVAATAAAAVHLGYERDDVVLGVDDNVAREAARRWPRRIEPDVARLQVAEPKARGEEPTKEAPPLSLPRRTRWGLSSMLRRVELHIWRRELARVGHTASRGLPGSTVA